MGTRKLLAILVAVFSGAVVFENGCNLLGSGGYYGYGFPSDGLYDPTDTIQGVIDYRLDVMDSVAAGWSDYLLQ